MGSEKGCPIEVHNIEIEKGDEMYDKDSEGGKSIPFHRAGYDRRTGQSPNNPRQQVSSQFLIPSFRELRGFPFLLMSIIPHRSTGWPAG